MNKSRIYGTATMNMVLYIKTVVIIHVLYLLRNRNTLLQINNSAKSQKDNQHDQNLVNYNKGLHRSESDFVIWFNNRKLQHQSESTRQLHLVTQLRCAPTELLLCAPPAQTLPKKKKKKKKKVWFYLALYPVHWTAQSALHFPPLADLFIPTPFSASLGSILAMQQLRNDYSPTFPPVSIARYSFIQLSRLRRREVKENAQTSQRYQRGFEPGLS